MVTIKQKGNFNNIESFLKNVKKKKYKKILEKYAILGVSVLSAATPKDTGFTASSWSYEIEEDSNGMSIHWTNSHIEKGYANIALLLQYGHGTRNGGYVEGRDYINPTMRPIFDKMANDAWMEVLRT